MSNKIILATVNCKKDLYAATADTFSAIAPNIQLGLLHSYLKQKGLDVEIIESDVEWISIDELINRLEEKQPLLFGLICSGANPSSSTMNMTGVIEFYKKFHQRKLKLPNFVWGPHPTVLPERTLKETNADFIVRGEGYETIIELYDAIKRGESTFDIAGLSYLNDGSYVHHKNVELVRQMDSLPFIDWNLMNPAKYRAHNWHTFGDIENRSPYAIIWTSFGCPFPCNFCCINNLFGKRVQRFRSVDNVIEEISILVEQHGVKHLKILDELFVVNPKRINEFCDKLEAKGYDLNMWAYSRVDTINKALIHRLKKVGVNWLSFGFETATPSILKQAEKGGRGNDNVDKVIRMTQDAGVNICADVIFGLWDEDMDSMNRTYDFLIHYNFEYANMYPVFPYPGTKLYDALEVKPAHWRGYALYGYECEPMSSKYLSAQEILRYRDEAFVRYHSRPEYLSMIEQKFGQATKDHILHMVSVPLQRKLLETADVC